MVGVTQNAGTPPQNVYILDTNKGANQQVSDLQQVVTLGQPCWDFDSSVDSSKLYVSQCITGLPNGSSTVGVQPATGGTLNTFFTSSTLAINEVRVIDSTDTYLLVTANNTGGDTSNDGLYKLKTDGSTPLRLNSNNAGETSNLNLFSQYIWSNVSRDGSLYALETVNSYTGTYTLLYGSLNGGTPTTIASISGTALEIAGWTKT
jgi:hypothetical protein